MNTLRERTLFVWYPLIYFLQTITTPIAFMPFRKIIKYISNEFPALLLLSLEKSLMFAKAVKDVNITMTLIRSKAIASHVVFNQYIEDKCNFPLGEIHFESLDILPFQINFENSN